MSPKQVLYSGERKGGWSASRSHPKAVAFNSSFIFSSYMVWLLFWCPQLTRVQPHLFLSPPHQRCFPILSLSFPTLDTFPAAVFLHKRYSTQPLQRENALHFYSANFSAKMHWNANALLYLNRSLARRSADLPFWGLSQAKQGRCFCHLTRELNLYQDPNSSKCFLELSLVIEYKQPV